MNREFHDLFRLLIAQGWTVVKTRAGHVKLIAPDGAPIFCAGTPSDYRAIRNVRAMCRRHGANV